MLECSDLALIILLAQPTCMNGRVFGAGEEESRKLSSVCQAPGDQIPNRVTAS